MRPPSFIGEQSGREGVTPPRFTLREARSGASHPASLAVQRSRILGPRSERSGVEVSDVPKGIGASIAGALVQSKRPLLPELDEVGDNPKAGPEWRSRDLAQAKLRGALGNAFLEGKARLKFG